MEIKRTGSGAVLAMAAAPEVDQRGADAAEAGGGASVVLGALPGVKVCGSVARWLAAGPEGKNRGPRCPQPARAAALAARTSVLTRIWEAFNMRKL